MEKDYLVCWIEHIYKSTTITAKSAEEAREKFWAGDFDTGEINDDDQKIDENSVEVDEV